MSIFDDVKISLRISATTTALDVEIADLITSAQFDLDLSGVSPLKTADTTDVLIKRAIILYTKANFGLNNLDAEKIQKSYDMLKAHLSLANDYNGGV